MRTQPSIKVNRLIAFFVLLPLLAALWLALQVVLLAALLYVNLFYWPGGCCGLPRIGHSPDDSHITIPGKVDGILTINTALQRHRIPNAHRP